MKASHRTAGAARRCSPWPGNPFSTTAVPVALGVWQPALSPFLQCFPTEDSPRPGQRRGELWIWSWFLSLPHFLTHWAKLRGLKKLWFLSEAEPNWGTLYPPHTASLLTSAVGHWGLYLTPHDKGLHLGLRSELVEGLQRWMATNSCHPSLWRNGARGERVGCLPRSHCFWKFCAPQLESHVLGPVLEFSLSLPLGSSSDGVLVLDNPLLQPLSLPSPTPSSYTPILCLYPAWLTSARAQFSSRATQALRHPAYSSVRGGRVGTAPTCCR